MPISFLATFSNPRRVEGRAQRNSNEAYQHHTAILSTSEMYVTQACMSRKTDVSCGLGSCCIHLSFPMCCVPQALKPGGRLFFTDYARSADTPSKGFAAYIQQRQYDLHTVEGYGKLLQEAGFVDVRAEDQTHLVSLNHLKVSKHRFASDFVVRKKAR